MVRNFLEYMNSKKKIEKPKIKVIADEVDCPKDKTKKPPKGQGMVGNQQPYVKEGAKPKKAEKGFGDVDGAPGVHHDIKKNKKPAKLAIAESCFDVVPVLRETAKDDPRTVELLVNDFKRHGLLGALVGELLSHKEAYLEMAGVMSSKKYGQEVCNRLARAIREVSAPYHDEMDAGAEIDPNAVPGEEGLEDDPLADPSEMGDDEEEFDPDAHLFGDEEDEDMEVVPGDEDLEDEEMLGTGEEDPNLDAPPEVDAEGNPLPPQGHMGQDVPPALEHLNYAMKRIVRG